MSEKTYLKSSSELEEGQVYYTQLEKWQLHDTLNQYNYTGKYISSQIIEQLIDNNQEAIAEILLETYTIPVNYNERIIVTQKTLSIIANHLLNTQSTHYHKSCIEKYIVEIAKIFQYHGNETEDPEGFINTIYDIINEDISEKLEEYNYNSEEMNPIEIQIKEIKNIIKKKLSFHFSKKKIEDMIIDDDFNIPALIESTRNFLYTLYYQEQLDEESKENEINTFNDLLPSLQNIIHTIDHHIFGAEGNNRKNPKIANLYDNLLRYIGGIDFKPNTNEDHQRILIDIQDIYISFFQEAYETEDIAKYILYAKPILIECDNIIQKLLTMKKYKYENISPNSVSGLYITLLFELKEGKNKDTIIDTIEQFKKFSKENIEAELNTQELENIKSIFIEYECYELMSKIV